MRIVFGNEESVLVNRDFTISLPKGFAYEVSQWENDPNCAVAIALYDPTPTASAGDFEPTEDDNELMRLEMAVKNVLDGTAEVTTQSVKNILDQVAEMLAEGFGEKYGSDFSRETKIVKETPEVKAGYSRMHSVITVMGEQFDILIYYIFVATKWALYEGKTTIMDEAVSNHQSVIEKLLASIKPVEHHNSDQTGIAADSAVVEIHYDKNQYYTLGEIKLPIPDGMYYAAEKLDGNIPNGTALPTNEKTYAFLVSGIRISNPSVYKDSTFGYSVTIPQPFSTMNWFLAPIDSLVKQFSEQLQQRQLESYGEDHPYACVEAKRNFIVLWAPFKKSDDPRNSDSYWESIVYSVFTKSMSYHGTVFVNGSAQKVRYEKLFQEFLSRIRPAIEEEVNEDGLENPLNLKNLIEVAGGTVVDWPGKDELGPNEDTELDADLLEAIDEAARNAPAQLNRLADRLKKAPPKAVKTAGDAASYISGIIESEKDFHAGMGEFFGPPAVVAHYEIPELLVEGEYGYYKRTLDVSATYSTECDGKTALKQIKEDLIENLLSIKADELKEMLIHEAKRAKLHDDPLVSRRTHLLQALPAVFKLSGTDAAGRTQRIESVRTGDRLLLRADYENRDYSPVAIEVLNERKESLGYLAGTRLQGFRDNALDDIAYLLDYVQASVKEVTPLSKRRKGSKYALMSVELSERADGSKKHGAGSGSVTKKNFGTSAAGAKNYAREEAEAKKSKEAEDARKTAELNRAREAELAKRAEERRRKEEEKRRREEERKAQAEIEKYQREMRAFAKDLPQQLLSQLEQESSQKANQFSEQMNKLQASLDQEIEAVKNKAVDDLNRLSEKNKADKRTLESLGLFKISEKKALKAAIAQQEEDLQRLRTLIDQPNDESVAAIRASITQVEKNRSAYEAGVNNKRTAITRACKLYRQRVEGYLQYHYKPNGNSIQLMSKMSEDELRREEVAAHLLEKGFFGTYEEMKMQDSYLQRHSSYVVSALSRLVSRGLAAKERRYDGKYEYWNIGTTSNQIYIIDDRGWDIDSPPPIPTLDNVQSYF